MPRFKALFFIKIDLKLSYFCKKMQKFRLLCACGGWGICPQPLKTAPSPIANFWLRACQYHCKRVSLGQKAYDIFLNVHFCRLANEEAGLIALLPLANPTDDKLIRCLYQIFRQKIT